MTDRINAITVVLDRDIREDDAQAIISAIQQLRYVVSVTPNVVEISDHIAAMRARKEWREKIMGLLLEAPQP